MIEKGAALPTPLVQDLQESENSKSQPSFSGGYEGTFVIKKIQLTLLNGLLF